MGSIRQKLNCCQHNVVRIPLLLLFFVCGWKIATESLFIVSGAFYGGFEFIERGASMVAPLALYLIILMIKEQKVVKPDVATIKQELINR